MQKKPASFFMPARDEVVGWIRDMYELGPRRPGTHADHLCENYLLDHLQKLGLTDVRKEPIPMKVWEGNDSCLRIRNKSSDKYHEIPAFQIPYTAFTPSQGVTGRLLYVNSLGLPAPGTTNWKGRIVVADIGFPTVDAALMAPISLFQIDPDGDLNDTRHPASWVRLNWNLYRQAAARGAAGFIGILKDHYPGGHKYYAPYGYRDKDIHDCPIPGFWVDRVVGRELRTLAKKGRSNAKLWTRGTLAPGVTHNVVGEIPGKSKEAYIIACHHDAPFASAVEDASGCAVILAAAAHLAKAGELNRSVIVLFTAGHFYGSIGSRSFIKAHKHDLLRKTALEFHVEHIAREAVEAQDGSLHLLDRPEPIGAFVSLNRHIKNALKNAFVSEGISRVVGLPPEGPFGDYPPTDGGDFHEAGTPIVNLISSPIYLLNAEDTPDKVYAPRLLPTARAVVRVLRELDRIPLEQLRKPHYPIRAAMMNILNRSLKSVRERAI